MTIRCTCKTEMIPSMEKSVRKKSILIGNAGCPLFKADYGSIISNPKSHTIPIALSSQL